MLVSMRTVILFAVTLPAMADLLLISHPIPLPMTALLLVAWFTLATRRLWTSGTDTTYFSLERPDALDSAPCVNGVCAVPEPETYALLLAGLALMSVVSRRRKQRAA